MPHRATHCYANHVSWLDIVIYGHLFKPAFVSKAEVGNWPVVGAIARATGTLFLPRGAFKTDDTSAQLAESLSHGQSVVLFPEATTSDAATPRRFHARLFAAAVDNNAQVQPLTIRYLPEDPSAAGHHPLAPWIDDAGLGGHLWRLLKHPGLDVAVEFCAPIDSSGHDRNAIAKACHTAICNALVPAKTHTA